MRVWAADLPALFAEAARGMYALMELHLADSPRTARSFDVHASDPESLLVAFLSELLYLLENEHLAFEGFQVVCGPDHLHVQMSGTAVQSQTHLVKAATYHNLEIQRKKGRYEAEIVFDV